MNHERPGGNNLLGFIIPHEVTRPPELEQDKQLVVQKFNELVADLVRQGGSAVRYYPDPSTMPSHSLELKVLSRRARNASEFCKVNIGIFGIDRPKIFSPHFDSKKFSSRSKYINLTHVVDSRDREAYSYGFEAGSGVVRRLDFGDIEVMSLMEELFDARQPGRDYLAEGRGEVENNLLEEAMGLNNQPIAMTEIDGLAALLQSPNIAPIN